MEFEDTQSLLEALEFDGAVSINNYSLQYITVVILYRNMPVETLEST